MSNHRIIPRSEWGARYRDGFGARPIGSLERWLHHSVTTQLAKTATLVAEKAEIRKLEDIGQIRFKGGISYTFIIAPSGHIFQGHSISRVGAHTQGHNTKGVGIALLGNYQNMAPTPEQEAAIAWLLTQGVASAWWKPRALSGGHRDTKATACPGNRAYPRIPAINALAAKGGVTGPSTPAKPAGKRVLSYGSVGQDVKELQTFLKACGLYTIPLDTVFGAGTLTALKAYQKAVGLADDGYCGSRTWAKIDAGVKPSTQSKPAPSKPAPAPSAGKGDTQTVSIVAYLNSIKQPSSFSARAALAKKHGITPYSGTAAQNTALLNKLRNGKSAPAKPAPKPAPKPAAKTVTQMATEVIRGEHGNGHAQRQKSLGINAATYAKVRAEVNRRA